MRASDELRVVSTFLAPRSPVHDTETSVWKRQSAKPTNPNVEGVHVDALIIGAGITGLTAANQLVEQGRTVAVFDRDGVACGETGRDPGQITEAVDARFHLLKRQLGLDRAKVVAEALRAGVDGIEERVRESSIDCQFQRLPGYLFTEQRAQVAQLKSEAVAANDVGIRASFVNDVPLPFAARGAVRYEDQAQFNPVAYAEALAGRLGSMLFIGIEVTSVEDGDPCVVQTDAGRLTAGAVFFANSAQAGQGGSARRNVTLHRSYALAAPWKDAPPEGVFRDTDEPYHSIRWHEDQIVVSGDDPDSGGMQRLESWAHARFGDIHPTHRWSSQITRSKDGLPLIGLEAGRLNVYLAHGYARQGTAFGTYAGMLVADLISGAGNDLSGHAARLFDPSRS